MLAKKRVQVVRTENVARRLKRRTDCARKRSFVSGRKRRRRREDVAFCLETIDGHSFLRHLRFQSGESRAVVVLGLQHDGSFRRCMPTIHPIVRPLRKCFETDSYLSTNEIAGKVLKIVM